MRLPRWEILASMRRIVSVLTQYVAVKDTLVGGSAYLSSVASDVYALQVRDSGQSFITV
jgi:hypothetical protein